MVLYSLSTWSRRSWWSGRASRRCRQTDTIQAFSWWVYRHDVYRFGRNFSRSSDWNLLFLCAPRGRSSENTRSRPSHVATSDRYASTSRNVRRRGSVLATYIRSWTMRICRMLTCFVWFVRTGVHVKNVHQPNSRRRPCDIWSIIKIIHIFRSFFKKNTIFYWS